MARKSINPTSAKKPTIEPTIGPAIQALSFPLSELLRVASGEADAEILVSGNKIDGLIKLTACSRKGGNTGEV